MLSFYEFNDLLEKNKKGVVRVNEAGISPELRAKLMQIRNSKGGQPATVEPTPDKPVAAPTPAEAPAARKKPTLSPEVMAKVQQPAEAPAAAPKPNRAKATPPVVNAEPDINSPDNPDFHSDERLGGLRTGAKPSSSKAMQTVATDDKNQGRLAKAMDRVAQFNQFLRSPTYQGLTALALTDLGVKADLPDGPFILSNKPTGRENEVVIDNLPTLLKVMRKVNSYLHDPRESGGDDKHVSFRQALASKWNENPGFNPTILRALQMESALHDPEVVGKPMTLDQLAQVLGQKAMKGGLDVAGDDKGALNYLIQTAEKNGFGDFFERQGDTITVVPLRHLGATGDPLAGKSAPLQDQIRSVLDRKKEQTPAVLPARPRNESADWMDIYELCEHWQF